MSRFTHIPRRHTGPPRFPQEGSEPASGPVVEYRLTQEEIAARYGPPTGKNNQGYKLSRNNLVGLLQTKTVGQVAEMRGIPQKLVFELCEKYAIELDEKNRLAGGDDVGTMKQAREKLPKEEFERLFWQGLSDGQIAEETEVAYHFVTRLKKEYGLVGIARVGRPKQKEDKPMIEPQEQELVENTVTLMTIFQVLELQEKTQKDAACVKELIDDLTGSDVTPGVMTLLIDYQINCTKTLERINKAFESTEITI